MQSSPPRASRFIRSGSRLSTASRSTLTTPVTNLSQACPPTLTSPSVPVQPWDKPKTNRIAALMSQQLQSALIAEGLTNGFPGVAAVDQLSFDVRPGKTFGLA